MMVGENGTPETPDWVPQPGVARLHKGESVVPVRNLKPEPPREDHIIRGEN